MIFLNCIIHGKKGIFIIVVSTIEINYGIKVIINNKLNLKNIKLELFMWTRKIYI